MAKNIALMGAVFPDVPSILLPQQGGGLVSYVDITDTTAAAADVASGKYFYTADGTKTQGTASGGGGGITVIETPDSHGGTIVEITGEEVTLQSKSVSYTPSETAQSATIAPDNGYTGLSSVAVSIGAISSTYVGSGITRRSSSDLSASGATVTVPSGYYSSQETKSVSNGTAGTPTATKGTVSNNSITVTPSVTNTSGYITGSTKTGTAVTVSASELVSGSETKTANGTYDVTNLAELVVNVASGGKNVQVEHGTKRIAATAYTDVGYEITVAKTGTYNVSWAGWRSSTSGTNGAQLYVNGTASGDAVTSFDSTWTNVQNGSRTSVSLTKSDKVTLRARSRGTSYYMYIFFLSIEEV